MHDTVVVTVFLDAPFDGGSFWTLEDPVRGALDSTFAIAGDLGTNLAASSYDITIRRGRSSQLNDVDVGTATVSFRNHTRSLDPLNTAGPYTGLLVPGRAMSIDVYGQRIYTGYTDDWLNEYTVGGDAIGSFPCIDGLGILGRQQFDAWTATAGQTAGPRITDILNRPEVTWPGGARSIGTGVSTLIGDNVTWGSNPLNYIRLVAQSDQGVAFVDRNGVFTYRDRLSLVNPTPIVTFADNGTGYPFSDAKLSGTSGMFYSSVSVDREGGTVQTANDATVGAASAIRRLSIPGLLLDSDSQSLALAQWLLSLYKTPIPRVQTLTVNMLALASDAERAAVARLDLGDVIRDIWTPKSTGSQIDQNYSIEGVEHAIPFDGPHLVTFVLAPITQSSAWKLEDPVLGAIDSIARIAF